jgi:hypothetical protein
MKLVSSGRLDEFSSLSIDEIKDFPSNYLCSIDSLWRQNSRNKFGFSIQKKIWFDCGNGDDEYNLYNYMSFIKAVGWVFDNRWVELKDLNYTLHANDGHLPSYKFAVGMMASIFSVVGGLGELDELDFKLFTSPIQI